MKRLIKEPLVHFLLLGFLIFGYYYWIKKDTASEDTILINDAEYNYLLSTWKKQWQQDPNEEEIKAFLDQYLRQEVFYKEALNIGLDHNDIIIKRRLAQKMEAVSNDMSAMVKPPTDEELKAFYEENKDLFQLPEVYSFQQILFLDDEPGVDQEIQKVKAALEKGEGIPSSRRTKLALKNSWGNAYANDIHNAFGDDFTNALEQAKLNQWIILPSGFGKHLVYISSKDDAGLAHFDEIKSYVKKEFEYRTEVETQEQVYQDLLKKYQVEITASNVPENIVKSFQP
jgi:hypothetical protein